MEQKHENKYTEEIYKCSKCGLCQKFCPVYKATKNEFLLPRGRYIILNNFFKNNQNLSKDFIKSLDICTNCNLCKKYCPSDIDYNKILSNIKEENKQFQFYKKFKKILLWNKLYSLIYKYFPFKSIFLNTNIDKLYNVKIKRKKQNPQTIKGNVIFFQGCVNQYINPSDKNASLNLIEKLGYSITSINNNCCGYPLLCDDNPKAFKNNSEKIKKSIPKNIDYIVCSCNTCYETLQNIEEIKDKLISIENLLEINNKKVEINENYSNYNEDFSLMKNLFMLKQPKISKEIAKTFNYSDKIVKTSCQLTKWSLAKYNIKTASIAEITSISDKN